GPLSGKPRVHWPSPGAMPGAGGRRETQIQLAQRPVICETTSRETKCRSRPERPSSVQMCPMPARPATTALAIGRDHKSEALPQKDAGVPLSANRETLVERLYETLQASSSASRAAARPAHLRRIAAAETDA